MKKLTITNQDPQTIVVVPSITLDSTIRGARQQAYEERYLFLLLLLRQPRLAHGLGPLEGVDRHAVASSPPRRPERGSCARPGGSLAGGKRG